MNTTDSILLSIKKMLGPGEEYDHFDPDIIMHINSVFAILKQMGVGPAEGFAIEGADETWDQFLGDNIDFVMVKTYMYMKVKLIFDPPLSSAVIDAMNRLIEELEVRLFTAADPVLVIPKKKKEGGSNE